MSSNEPPRRARAAGAPADAPGRPTEPRSAPRARDLQKAATRERLLEAARRCFERRGYSATVVADIVREAGVAHGTFYVHFSGVAAAADALLEGFNQSLASRLGPLLLEASPAGELEPIVRRAAGLFLDALDDDRALVRFYAERATSGLPPEALATGINPPALEAITAALVQRAERAGSARLALVAHGLLALWLRVGLRYALEGGVLRGDALEVLVALTTGALSSFDASPTERHERRRPRATQKGSRS